MDILWKNFWLGDRYRISNTGVVYDSLLGKDVAQSLSSDGYCKVTLRLTDSVRKTYSVHRLVAQSFIDNPMNKPTVNHMDGDKLNNLAENLEWATRSEQTQHAWDNGLIMDMGARRDGIRKHQGKRVLCVTTGVEYPSIGAAAEELNLKKSNLSRVCHGDKGYRSCGKAPDGTPLKWRFVE